MAMIDKPSKEDRQATREALNAKAGINSLHPELTHDSLMPLGSYKGIRMEDVPHDYLKWLSDQVFKSGKSLYTNNKNDRVRQYYESYIKK